MIAPTLGQTRLSGTVEVGAADTDGAEIESRGCAGLENEVPVA
jgi:hypothetical protein